MARIYQMECARCPYLHKILRLACGLSNRSMRADGMLANTLPWCTMSARTHLVSMILVVLVDLALELAQGGHQEGVELAHVGRVDRYAHAARLGVDR